VSHLSSDRQPTSDADDAAWRQRPPPAAPIGLRRLGCRLGMAAVVWGAIAVVALLVIHLG
jgi:hypothetical protein